MKKRAAALLLAAMFAVTAGCGTKDSGDADGTTTAEESEETQESAEFTPKLDTDEEVTLNIIGSLENFESLEAVITDFSEYYSNCEVLYSVLGDYNSLLATRLASDDTVGIFMVTNLSYKGSVQEKCADLSKEDIDTSAIQDEALAANTADGGKLYGLPLASNTYGFIVNETLLENEGLSVPENYEDFLSVCESLKEKGYTPIQGCQPDAAIDVIRNMAYVLLSDTYDTQDKMDAFVSEGEGGADAMLPAFEVLTELYEKGYIDDEVNQKYTDTYDSVIMNFFEGDVPFAAGTTETFSGTKKRETKSEHYSEDPFDYKFICVPISEDGAYSYIQNWNSFAVNEDCEQKEWAVEFLRFLATEDEINELANIKGLPSVAKDSDDGRFTDIFSSDNDMVYTSDTYISAEVDDAFYHTVEALIGDGLDAEGAVAKFEELLSNGGSE